MTRTYKYAFSSPDYFLDSAAFYKKAVLEENSLESIAAVARWAGGKDPDALAESVCSLLAQDPPDVTDFPSALRYFKSRILKNVPKAHHYDDIFWCCLLSRMDALGYSDLSIGGPIHRALSSIYDDFHPGDVTLG